MGNFVRAVGGKTSLGKGATEMKNQIERFVKDESGNMGCLIALVGTIIKILVFPATGSMLLMIKLMELVHKALFKMDYDDLKYDGYDRLRQGVSFMITYGIILGIPLLTIGVILQLRK